MTTAVQVWPYTVVSPQSLLYLDPIGVPVVI